MSREDALRALADTDWSGAEVAKESQPAMSVYSTRLPRNVAKPLEDEATRRGVTPSALIRQLVEAALARAAEDATVTVRLSDLHRAIDTVVKPAA